MISRSNMIYTTILLLFACLGILPRCGQAQNSHCFINITQASDNQPLLLRHNTSDFLYPKVHSPSTFEGNIGKADIRLVCPADLLVANEETLGIGSGFLKCRMDANFGIAGSQVSIPFTKISCARPPTPIMRLKRGSCPIGKCIQTGFLMNIFTFLPVIDCITYDTENKVPIWAHAKVVAVIESRQKSREASEFKVGPLLQNTTIEISDIYNRDYQRKRLRAIFDDPEGGDWYMNDMIDESKYFVEGQLISRYDFFYKSQQQSTYFYENVVPMWSKVEEGNWRYVSSIVRKLASETMTDLDVWSGSIGVLTMQSSNGAQRKLYLARDLNGKSILPAPKILFKYVHDKRANRGLVFLVVNNPHLDKINSDYVICKRQIVCESMFPQFTHLDKGYSYCCTLDGFLETAKSLGLPTFAGASSIGT